MTSKKRRSGKGFKNKAAWRRYSGLIYTLGAVLIVAIIAMLYHYSRTYGLIGTGLVGLFAGIFLVRRYSSKPDERKWK